MNILLEYMLPLMFAAALSPSFIMAEIVILATPRARLNGLLFLLGILIGQAIISAAALLVGRIGKDSLSQNNHLSAILYFLAALFFAFIACRTWLIRPKPDQPAAAPGWLQHIDRLGPLQTLGVGTFTASVGNIKNITITLSVAAIIAQATESLRIEIILMSIFTLAPCSLIALPYIIYVINPPKAKALLAPIRQWLITYSTVILMTLFITLAFVFAGQGLGQLGAFS